MVCAKQFISGVMGEVGHVWVGCEWAVEHGVCACEMFVEDTLDCGGGCFVRAGSCVALEQVGNLVFFGAYACEMLLKLTGLGLGQ